MYFPKVLIIGQSFNNKNGGGITLSNLFHGWPKDSLAVASNTFLSDELDLSICEKYYQLGYNSKTHPFPLSIFLPKIQCGPVSGIHAIKTRTEEKQSTRTKTQKYLYKRIFSILNYLGIYYFFYKLKLTRPFKEWVENYNPDIIYSHLASLELIRFVDKLQVFLNKPIAIHIMDDWPKYLIKPGLFSFYWKKVVNKELMQLFDKTSVLLSICQAMSEEYQIRYNKVFIPFHNPIEIMDWLPYSKKDWSIKDKFTVLYAGRIGRGVQKSIIDIATVITDLCRNNDRFIFEIQTNDISIISKHIKVGNCIKWIKPIEYSELPRKFSNVDLLVIPEDFDEGSVEFLKYSIQTKVAEYMVSGTPILVYADKRTALAKSAIKDDWAIVVSENSKKHLEKAIIEIFSDISLRKRLGERAKMLAIENENAEIERERFRKCLAIE